MTTRLLALLTRFATVLGIALLVAGCARTKPGTPAVRPAGSAGSADTAQHHSPAPGTLSSTSVTPGVAKLGFDLLARRARTDADKNVFISPASIALALAMTWNGAAGSTNYAMAQVLGLADTAREAVNSSYRSLLAALGSSDTTLQLDIANSLWLRKGIAFDKDFLRVNQQTFAAEIDNLDFNQSAVVRINDWVSQKTHGKIAQIIGQLDQRDYMILVNAVYFKGIWTHAFDAAVPGPFTLTSGATRQAPMMRQSGRYLHLRGPGFEAAALPYGSGRASMYVFLPDHGVSLDSLIRELRSPDWDSWRKKFSDEKGSIQLPRFKFEYEVELNGDLGALGMAEAFSTKANFTRMTSVPVFISEVIHKTYVDVTEKGTEAAAVTSVRVGTTSVPTREPEFSLTVDRPFLVVIYDGASNATLFAGAIRNPGE